MCPFFPIPRRIPYEDSSASRITKSPFYRIIRLITAALIFLLTFSLLSPLHAQNDVLKFDHLTIAEGLPANNVTCVFQDHQGFLWFGTSNGLVRYDGYNMKVFKHDPDDPRNLSFHRISEIFEDHTGTLWVGTNVGLNRFDRELESFKAYRNMPDDPQSLSHNFVNAIYEDRAGRLWIGTWSGGLNLFDREQENFLHIQPDSGNRQNPSTEVVTAIYEDPKHDGILWIGTYVLGARLVRFDSRDGTYAFYARPSAGNNYIVWSICADRAGGLWLGTGDGLDHFDPETETFLNYKYKPDNPEELSSNDIRAVYEDRAGMLWLATFRGGLNTFEPKKKTFRHYQHDPNVPQSLSGNHPVSIFEDRSGILWIGTIAGGVNRLDRNKEKFRRIQHDPADTKSLNDNAVTAFYEDRAGILWIGTANSGLNAWDRKKGEFRHYQNEQDNAQSLNQNYVWSIREDSRQEGILWVGTNGGGLNRFDRKNEKFKVYKNDPNNPNSLASDYVSAIYEDSCHGATLWLATWNGLEQFDRKQEIFRHYQHDPDDPSSLRSNGVFTIFESRQGQNGHLWVGTEKGLSCMDRETGRFAHFQHEPGNLNSLNSNVVYGIGQDQAGGLWVGTEAGLNRLVWLHESQPGARPMKNYFYRVNPVITRYSEKDGLPGDIIYGILTDGQGRLWLSTNKGLATLRNPAHNAATPPDFKIFDLNDGLQGYVFSERAYFKNTNGEMFFGGKNGFNFFHPDSIKDNPDIPPVVITAFEKFDTDHPEWGAIAETGISAKREIALTHKNTIFSIEFAALNYVDSHKNRYAYKLEGFNNNWIQLGTQRRVTFTNLDAGEYIFRVKGSNNDGIWNEEGASLTISIAPPWWKTWWAYALYGVIFFSLLYSLRRYEMNRQQFKHRAELEHVQAEKERVEAEKLKDLDRMKSRFFANISHEFRTPLTLILGPLENLLTDTFVGDAKKQYGLMKRNAQRLLRLINQLLDLSKLESGKLTLEASYGNLIPFLKGLVYSFESLATRNNIALNFETETDEAMLAFDRDKMEQIITNLLSNAFKFTPEGGSVAVAVADGNEQSPADGIQNIPLNLPFDKLRTTPSKGDLKKAVPETASSYSPLEGGQGGVKAFVTITIRDTGIGIPADRLPHIFDRFYQASESYAKDQPAPLDRNSLFEGEQIDFSYPTGPAPLDGNAVSQHAQIDYSYPTGQGTGIGLALTKELVELHGGEIRVTSEVGKGTEFTVRLPVVSEQYSVGSGQAELAQENIPLNPPSKGEKEIAPPFEGQRPELVEGGQGGMSEQPTANNEQQTSSSEQPASSDQQQASSNEIILIVEDNSDMRAFIREQMQDRYQILEAEDGQAGLEKAVEAIPDLIISDVMMPKMDGYQLCAKLKSDERTSHVPVVLLTAKSSGESKIEGLELGADDYLIKPFDRHELLARVKNLIAQRRKLRERFSHEVVLEPAKIAITPKDEIFLQRALAIVEESMSDDEFSVEQFSRAIGMSESQLLRKLKALTNQTPNHFIRSLRLKRAVQLLQENAGTVSEIAFEVGFNNLSYFAKCFREQFGKPPSEFNA